MEEIILHFQSVSVNNVLDELYIKPLTNSLRIHRFKKGLPLLDGELQSFQFSESLSYCPDARAAFCCCSNMDLMAGDIMEGDIMEGDIMDGDLMAGDMAGVKGRNGY
ncbi:hypothetical protein NQZ68_018561 [Dissostichus eleginoides]|nr:hypothetical protein NQZ68_018561 [Dissostichus eleginoides]